MKIPGTDVPGYGDSDHRFVLNSWSFTRLGIYGLSLPSGSARGLSLAWNQADDQRHRSPSATDLIAVNSASHFASPLLDYLLWQYSGTTDPVVAAGLHLAVWHLAVTNGVAVGPPPGAPAWPASISFPSDNTPPVNAAGGSLPASGEALGNLIEQQALALVAGKDNLLGPWTIDMTMSWATKVATVTLRSANNSPVNGVTINVSSANSSVPSSVVTDGAGQATFGFTPFGTEATVNVSATGPGLHSEYDVDSLTSGYQRVAVGNSMALNDSYTVKEPLISSFAKDAVDGDKLVGAGGSIVDTLQYSNLTPGSTYTARVLWYYQDDATPSSLSATSTFVAGPTGAGSVDVGPVTTGISELGRSLVAYQFLFAGPTIAGVPEVIHANISDPNQTLTVQSLLLSTTARDQYDGDNLAYPGASVIDTVTYVGLAPGLKYTARVEWAYTDGFSTQGTTGLTATKTFFADANGFGTVDVGPVSLTGAETGRTIIAYERIFVGESATGTPLAIKEDPGDASQMIAVLAPTLITVVKDDADDDKVVDALGFVSDNLVFSGLHPGVTYTARLELHYTDGIHDQGATGLVATKTFVPDAPSGAIVVGPVHLNSAVSGERLVAFQRIYVGTGTAGSPAALHEDPTNTAQIVQVLPQTIFTDATEGTAQGVAIAGDKQITIGSGSTIVDTVTFQAAVGASIQVVGRLVRFDGNQCSEPLTEITINTTVPADHTVRIVYPLPEAPGDYVAYALIRNPAGFNVAAHEDCLAESQRVTLSLSGDGNLPETR